MVCKKKIEKKFYDIIPFFAALSFIIVSSSGCSFLPFLSSSKDQVSQGALLGSVESEKQDVKKDVLKNKKEKIFKISNIQINHLLIFLRK